MASAIKKPPSVQEGAQPFGQKTLKTDRDFRKKQEQKVESRRRSEVQAQSKQNEARLQAARRQKLKARTQPFKNKIDVMA